MSVELKEVIKRTLSNLNKNSILATPHEYSKEFCKVANTISLSLGECKKFADTVSKLSKNEQLFIKENDLTTFEDIIPLLLKRVNKDGIESMANIIKDSLQPSITINLNEDLHAFSVKIGDSPELLFESDIQEEIKKFIEQRINLDKNELDQKAKEIAKVMTYITKYLAEAIDSNSHGSSHISDIAKDIESLDASNHNDLVHMKVKLVDAAKSIESAMSQTTDKLKDGHTQVQKLQNKIKQLESELESSKKESDTDHLTGLLTRRAYDRQSSKIEELYIRNNVNYALVFFDIDHFKKVNDDYGHDAGDVILTTFAKVLLKSTRDLDIVGRYGGEEFVAILHFNNEDEIKDYIKRVKSIITGHKFKYNKLKIPITFSAGVTIRDQNSSYDDSIHNADKLLYQAKNTGRNRIIFQDGTIL